MSMLSADLYVLVHAWRGALVSSGDHQFIKRGRGGLVASEQVGLFTISDPSLSALMLMRSLRLDQQNAQWLDCFVCEIHLDEGSGKTRASSPTASLSTWIPMIRNKYREQVKQSTGLPPMLISNLHPMFLSAEKLVTQCCWAPSLLLFEWIFRCPRHLYK